MFDPAQLAAFHRRGAFDLAAAELHVTPCTIWQCIRAPKKAAATLFIRRATLHRYPDRRVTAMSP